MTMDVSRRAFVSSSIATGFALAVRPVSAQTITTDATGIVAADVKITSGGKEMPGYSAMPEGKGPFPFVLVVQEIFGVHEHIKDLCRRLAKQGYYAVAPELYFRQGDPKTAAGIEDVLKIVAKVPDDQVMADLDATVAFARKTGKVDGARVAITGFCWGGRITWLYAAKGGVKTGAAWYGRISNAPNAMTTRSSIDVAATLKVPVIGLYAGHDSGIPVAHVELMKKELAKGKSGSELNVYPDAQHGFNADYRPSYAKKDAEDAWAKMLAWFKKNGV